jgi:hypothetical protein
MMRLENYVRHYLDACANRYYEWSGSSLVRMWEYELVEALIQATEYNWLVEQAAQRETGGG